MHPFLREVAQSAGGFMIKYSQNLKILARNLRKNMTKEERKLWYEYLRECGVRFLRQKPIGNYIVDFYSPKAKLVIELDGGQHYEDVNIFADKQRDEYFADLGLQVLRYTNIDINQNFESVCLDIKEHI